jgi:hypothetical protein
VSDDETTEFWKGLASLYDANVKLERSCENCWRSPVSTRAASIGLKWCRNGSPKGNARGNWDRDEPPSYSRHTTPLALSKEKPPDWKTGTLTNQEESSSYVAVNEWTVRITKSWSGNGSITNARTAPALSPMASRF